MSYQYKIKPSSPAEIETRILAADLVLAGLGPEKNQKDADEQGTCYIGNLCRRFDITRTYAQPLIEKHGIKVRCRQDSARAKAARMVALPTQPPPEPTPPPEPPPRQDELPLAPDLGLGPPNQATETRLIVMDSKIKKAADEVNNTINHLHNRIGRIEGKLMKIEAVLRLIRGALT